MIKKNNVYDSYDDEDKESVDTPAEESWDTEEEDEDEEEGGEEEV